MGGSIYKIVLCLLCGLLLAVGFGTLARAAPEPIQSHPGPEGAKRNAQEIVEIGDDSGGFVAEYALRLYEMRGARQKIEFVGRCDSACTLFLGLPIEQTCISEGAYFRFHAPSAPSASAAAKAATYMMRKYPNWVRAWIVAQGGLSDRLATMGYGYAKKFMRTCSLTQR